MVPIVKHPVYGTDIQLLVDTGATVTMLSKASFQKMINKRDIRVQRTEMEEFVADGNQLAHESKTDMEMHIGIQTLKEAAMVADIPVDGILGLDVIKRLGMIQCN